MKSQRILEIDLWRGVAVAGMIFFHFFFILNYLEILSQDMSGSIWWVFAMSIRISFLLLVGISLSFSCQNTPLSSLFLIKQLKRVGVIALAAFSVSLATWVYDPVKYVRFGILHVVALSVFLLIPFVRHKKFIGIIAILSFLSQLFIRDFDLGRTLGILLGAQLTDYVSLDWFPLFPWLGWVSFGVLLADPLKTYFTQQPLVSQQSMGVGFLQLLGRNALMIYLIHIPIMVVVIKGLRSLMHF